jgi:hypothetical protein
LLKEERKRSGSQIHQPALGGEGDGFGAVAGVQLHGSAPIRYNGYILAEREVIMGHPRYTRSEIAARAKAIYEEKLRNLVEPHHVGKYLVINVETGEYELDADDTAASRRAYEKFPNAALYGMRVGYPAWGRIGTPGAAPAP